jgi:Flp pilus assembly protein TadB
VTGGWLLGALCGLGCAAGVLLMLTGWYGTPLDAPDSPLAVANPPRHWPVRQLATAFTVALLVLVITHWVAVAIALGAVAGCWQRLFGGARATRLAMSRLEALAAWTESLRDMVATGAGLAEALPASAAAASPLLTPALATLTDRLRSREPLEEALRGYATDLDDVSADLVVAALLLNSRAQGRRLHAVLTALAVSVRAEVAMRRQIEADRAATRRGVQIVLAVTVSMAVGLRLANPGYVQPYSTPTGQFALAVIVAVFALGFGWLHRLGQLPVPDRFLANNRTVTAMSPADRGLR